MAQATSDDAVGLSFKLHPLVLLNVSDHYTRMKAQQPDGAEPPRQLGCLLGLQDGRNVEICNTFECVVNTDASGAQVIDKEYLAVKQAQYKQVFPKFEIVGWYSASSSFELRLPEDMVLHKSLLDINESPVYLTLGSVIPAGSKELPVKLHETVLRVVDGSPSLVFEEATYTVETVEAERIAVDNIADTSGQDDPDGVGRITHHLKGMHNAVKMLSGRIRALHGYVEKVRAGGLPYDHAVMRDVANLLRQLPALDSPAFRLDFNVEYNDTLLMAYLGTITKGTAAMNEYVDRVALVFDKHRGAGFEKHQRSRGRSLLTM